MSATRSISTDIGTDIGTGISTVKADSITRTASIAGAQRLEVVVQDRSGLKTTLDLSAAGAQDLLLVLSEFCAAQTSDRPQITKRPDTFSVGSGAYERVVLIRFEDDVPYGVSADLARDLAFAILDVSDELAAKPAVLHN